EREQAGSGEEDVAHVRPGGKWTACRIAARRRCGRVRKVIRMTEVRGTDDAHAGAAMWGSNRGSGHGRDQHGGIAAMAAPTTASAAWRRTSVQHAAEHRLQVPRLRHVGQERM